MLEPMLKDSATFADAQTRLAQLAYGLGNRKLASEMLIDDIVPGSQVNAGGGG